MTRALVDTSVLFAAAYRRDESHERALPILQGFDDGSLPRAVVLDYVLAETLNGLLTHTGQDGAVDFLDRIEENSRFTIDRLTTDAVTTAKTLFRRHDGLSFVDAALVAYLQMEDLEYLYTFDDDFDAIDSVTRLDSPVDPFDPNSE